MNFDSVTLAEMYDDGKDPNSHSIQRMLSDKDPNSWTKKDAYLAYIYGVRIPKGKMPKEIFAVEMLRTRDDWTARLMLDLPEAARYHEEAVDLYLITYVERWIRANRNSYRYSLSDVPETQLAKRAMDFLEEDVYSMIKEGVEFTWDNVRTLFEKVLVKHDASAITMESIAYKVAQKRNEKVPQDIMEMIKRIRKFQSEK